MYYVYFLLLKNEAPRSKAARYLAEFFRSLIPSFARLRRASEGLFSSPPSPRQAAGYLAKENKKIYTGSTNDLKRRKGEHDTGKVDYTKNLRPLKLIGYESYLLKTDAVRREKFLKTTEGKRLFRQQYRDILEKNLLVRPIIR